MTSQISTGSVRGAFPNTHWSVVLAATQPSSPESAAALEAICRAYWYPLYAYVRRSGKTPHDAQDLTQEFFSRLLKKRWLDSANPEKGKLRTFLLTALSRFLSNEWDRARAQKRGGGAASVPLDTEVAESRYCEETGNTLAPDEVYDRQWAMTVLARALARVEAEHQEAGKAAEFAVLSPALTAERGSIAYLKMARELAMSETAVRMAVHRLRKRFRVVFREEITQTVAQPNEVEEEIRHLLAVLTE